MFTVNNKDTTTTPLTSLILNIVNIDILKTVQLSHLVVVLKLLTLRRSLLGRMISQTKTLTVKSFFLFKFAITKIYVAIRLAENGRRMGGI